MENKDTMASESKIVIHEASNIQVQQEPGMASVIAVIGAFNSTVTATTLCTSVRQAKEIFGESTATTTFKGCDAVEFLFRGASSLLVVNTTQWSDDETPVPSTTITNQLLTDALTQLKGEEFDILFIAEELTDPAQEIVTGFLAEEYTGKNPHGQVSQLNRSTASAYETSVSKYGDHIYYINTQQIMMNGVTLDLNKSTAYICGVIAGLNVGRSLTSKVIPEVTAITPEYTFGVGDLGSALLDLSIPVLKCRSRVNREYICVSSELPNKWDLYINRTRDYLVKTFALADYLGEINNNTTLTAITGECERLYKLFVEDLRLIKDLKYSVEKVSENCVDIYLDKMVFDGIITRIDVYINITVGE